MKKSNIIFVLCLIIIIIFSCYIYYTKFYNSYNPTLEKVRSNFAKLKPEYATIPLREGDSAYTENKSVITLCLKDPDTGYEYDINTIMYVALHELSHMVSHNTGDDEHGPEFKLNFSKMLKEAAKAGIYDPRKPVPTTYCKIRNGESIE